VKEAEAMKVTAWTKQGQVAGERARGPVCVFRGIPYARPPVGPLRFRVPERPEAWQGTREARSFGSASAQDRSLATDIGNRSEDCLYLNVWTPAADKAKRPVMVWIHGGGFTSGSSAQELYDGTELAARGGVVVVSLNYRLGVLGFGYLRDVLGDKGRDLPANLGLRDQLAALRWVRDNIAEFGGDPENVTLFGESAGGMSVSVLLTSPEARGLFKRAIAQSGAAHHVLYPDQASLVSETLLRVLGSPERVFTASAEEIVVAQRECIKTYVWRGARGKRVHQSGITLMPVIDGEVLPKDPLSAITEGTARDVPLLAGATLEEWNYFLFLNEPDKRDLNEQTLLKVLEKRQPGLGQAAIDFYRALLGTGLPAWRIYSAFESDRSFRMPSLRLYEAHAAAGGSTFAYLFDYRSQLFHNQMGACHALDIPFVFGTIEGRFGKGMTGATEDAVQLSWRMLDAWAAFAKTGNPTHDRIGTWPAYDASARETLRLGLSVRVERDPLAAFRPFWDEII
jgi:para-nitrobenzyl esterase